MVDEPDIDTETNPRPVIGWREWIALPDLRIRWIKAKVDSGARSSSLHAHDISIEELEDGSERVHFSVYPRQHSTTKSVSCVADVLEHRVVRSSNGEGTLRPVILCEIGLLGQRWPVEVTLADRSQMGFRMLLGREAFRRRFLLDADRSYVGGRRRRRRRREK